MSHFMFDADYYEMITRSVPCPCNGRCNGCCVGSVSVEYRPRSPDEVAAIRARKQHEHEEAVLREAEQIQARRLA